jgi:hypothetical protein
VTKDGKEFKLSNYDEVIPYVPSAPLGDICRQVAINGTANENRQRCHDATTEDIECQYVWSRPRRCMAKVDGKRYERRKKWLVNNKPGAHGELYPESDDPDSTFMKVQTSDMLMRDVYNKLGVMKDTFNADEDLPKLIKLYHTKAESTVAADQTMRRQLKKDLKLLDELDLKYRTTDMLSDEIGLTADWIKDMADKSPPSTVKDPFENKSTGGLDTRSLASLDTTASGYEASSDEESSDEESVKERSLALIHPPRTHNAE